jgi:hypothetical protein
VPNTWRRTGALQPRPSAERRGTVLQLRDPRYRCRGDRRRVK